MTEFDDFPVEFRVWRDYEAGKVGIKRDDREPVLLDPPEAKRKAQQIRDVLIPLVRVNDAGDTETLETLSDQADMIDAYADNLAEIESEAGE